MILTKYSSKFIFIDSIKLTPTIALDDRYRPNKEKENIQKELNKNAR